VNGRIEALTPLPANSALVESMLSTPVFVGGVGGETLPPSPRTRLPSSVICEPFVTVIVSQFL